MASYITFSPSSPVFDVAAVAAAPAAAPGAALAPPGKIQETKVCADLFWLVQPSNRNGDETRRGRAKDCLYRTMHVFQFL